MNSVSYFKKLLNDYGIYRTEKRFMITKDVTRNNSSDVVIWEEPMNRIAITSREEYEREYKNQDSDYRVGKPIFETTDKEVITKLCDIILGTASYEERLKKIIALLSLNKEFNNDIVNYLRELLEEYEGYNKTRQFYVSLLAKIEKQKEFPCIYIWEDIDGQINITSKSEYDLTLEMIVKYKKQENNIPKLLLVVNDNTKVDEIIETVNSYRNYDDKITSLIYILDDVKKLELK